MPSSRNTSSWSRSATQDPAGQASTSPLGQRLRTLVDDRASTSAELVLAACVQARNWVLDQPEAWEWERAGLELESELLAFDAEQGWRGPCAVWIDSLRRAWHHGRARSRRGDRVSARGVLAEELDLWLGRREEDLQLTAGSAARRSGDGEAAGSRWPSRAELARQAAAPLEHGEVILVSTFSNSVALALQAAQRAGKRPHAIVAEDRPNRAGRRMAERLAPAGIPVTLCYDAALPANLPRTDRVWLSTEAIGSDALLACVGTRHLVEEADRWEVPVQVLATSDKLMPGGELSLPRYCERDAWLSWADAPAGVRLERQSYEAVSLDALPQFVTEIGAETATALHLRALRVEAAAPCGVDAADPRHTH